MKTDQSSIVNSTNTDFKANRGTGETLFRPYPPFRKRPPRSTVPRVVVIREEFIALTGDPLIAVVLNQLLYWTQRVKDFDLLLEEEKCLHSEEYGPPQYGWIYKSAGELIEETMLGVSKPTMRKYLMFLVDQGWAYERSDPDGSFNKPKQYRLNLRQLHADLQLKGYDLPGSIFPNENEFSFEVQSAEKPQICSLEKNFPGVERNLTQVERNLTQVEKNLPPVERNFPSVERNLTPYTYTEITTETTNREHTERARENQNILGEEKQEEIPSSTFFQSCLAEAMVKLWEKHLAGSFHLTQKRKQKLTEVLEVHFQSDIGEWDIFCQRVKASPFLMGEGSKGWRVSLDWILVEENLIKVLEGNFDDPAATERALSMQYKQNQDERTKEILASIEDPIWKDWCTKFTKTNFLREPISCSELEGIANAQFLEVEKERLVWVGSSDPKVLNKIEELRLPLSSIASKDFPTPRTIRTRLIEPQFTSERTDIC